MSAGQTTTADSEHILFWSLYFFFPFIKDNSMSLSSVHFIFTSKHPLSAGGTRSHLVFSPLSFKCRHQKTAVVARIGQRLTTRWSSVWWCRTPWWPQTETPLRFHLERRRSHLKNNPKQFKLGSCRSLINVMKNTHTHRWLNKLNKHKMYRNSSTFSGRFVNVLSCWEFEENIDTSLISVSVAG